MVGVVLVVGSVVGSVVGVKVVDWFVVGVSNEGGTKSVFDLVDTYKVADSRLAFVK